MEEDFFLKKMRGVKTFKKDEQPSTTKKNTKDKTTLTKNKEPKILKKTTETKQIINSDFKISFGDINKDLKRGKVKINRRLDLHGYNLSDAYDKFKKELIKAYNTKKRCLLVITGKGSRSNVYNNPYISDKTSILRNSVPDFVSNDPELSNIVKKITKADLKNGGDGAIYIFLKKL